MFLIFFKKSILSRGFYDVLIYFREKFSTISSMKQKSIFLLIFSIFFNSISFSQSISEKKTLVTYNQYCSTCHGEKIEAFVDRKWAHGKTKPEIIKTISEGYLEGGMPSWKTTLSKKDIDQMAALILKNLKSVDQYQFNNKKTDTYISGKMTIKLDTIASGFESPWGLTQLPGGDLLVTDRAGFLYRIDKNKNKILIKNTPKVYVKGQGGLMDVEIHPKYSENGWVYLSYSKSQEKDGKILATTAIARGKIQNDEFVELSELFEAKPYVNTTHHYGSRIVFDKSDYLYFSVGDRGKHFEYAQAKDNDLGKIHRILADGSIPADNPFKSPESVTAFSFGSRNPQGLALNSTNGEIWENEHGPRGGDEINSIRKSANYGWPVICYGINYDGKPITNISKMDGMEQPEYYYIPSIAPSGMAFVTGDKYPDWKGDILIGSLRFNYLERAKVIDNKVVKSQKELINVGRLRNVKMGSDGYIYIGIENPGMVFRLIPSKL